MGGMFGRDLDSRRLYRSVAAGPVARDIRIGLIEKLLFLVAQHMVNTR